MHCGDGGNEQSVNGTRGALRRSGSARVLSDGRILPGVVDGVQGGEDDSVVKERALSRADVQREQTHVERLELAGKLVLVDETLGDCGDALDRRDRSGLAVVFDDEEPLPRRDVAHPLDPEHPEVSLCELGRAKMDRATSAATSSTATRCVDGDPLMAGRRYNSFLHESRFRQ